MNQREDYRPAPPQPYALDLLQDGGGIGEVAVIVPAREAAPFLLECLESVYAQTLRAIELVVVDDASPDEGRRLARDWLQRHASRFVRVALASHPAQAGPAAARDTGVRLSRAAALLPLDADNRLFPRCLERCLQGLRASGAAFVYPILRREGQGSGLVSYQPFDPRRFAPGNYIDTLALMRRDAWETLGGFPHVEFGMEDYALWLALLEQGLVGAQVPEILAAYRVHARSRTQAMGAAYAVQMARLQARYTAVLARHGARPAAAFSAAPPPRP